MALTDQSAHARAADVWFRDDELLVVRLEDGRELGVPLVRFPRLAHASPQQRKNYRLVGRGVGIHWPDIDEDLSIESLLKG